ncbi:MAG: peptidylprolyl isomerase [Bacteroidales bacterium]|nr:peptidylprolyl isomerase [Bacteroidales bacterium]MDT8373701.1 peptidylprolyl isomerase [Bacteroidales bacterium]
MKSSLRILLPLAAVMLLAGCTSGSGSGVRAEIKTTEGDILIALSDLTPLHRDNFIKLAESGFYDGVSFHRVIKDFMIQTGDGSTKQDTSILNDDYTIPAEINDSLFHRRGAMAAARMGDDVNPDRNSSGTQFYIVQGKIYNDEELANTIQRIEYNRRQYLYNKALSELRREAMQSDTVVSEDMIQQNAIVRAYEAMEDAGPYSMPEEHIDVYKTVGGTPFLDGAYTVFGEVLEGMEVVDAIAATATDMTDRPVNDIRIINVKIIK